MYALILILCLMLGVGLEWVVPPPDVVKVDQEFTVTYRLLLDTDEFWEWAVNGGIYNVFGDVTTANIT